MKKVDKLIHSIGLKYFLSDKDIKEIVESPFIFTKEKMKQIDLTKIKSQEDVDKIKGTFLYKGLGRLYLSPKMIKKIINYNLNGRIKSS